MKGSSLLSQVPDGGNMFAELWRACAGPLVSVPIVGEKVFYFPQGHIEQVEACAHQDATKQMPVYNLPPKILCRVVNVHLKAERDTDEVFAQLTLLPELERQEESDSGKEIVQPFIPKQRVFSFCKILTASDTSPHGGFSIHKRHADECLPTLDMSQQPPAQELNAKDLHGAEWKFRHIFRGQPKRHLLTTGWSTFMNAKKLVTGDAFIFLRGENGELRVGVRRAMQKQIGSTSVISGQSMQLGVLASACHAFSTGTLFNVFYWPRKGPEFVVPFDRYMESIKNNYSVGTRFQMSVEGEDAHVKRLAGTIIGTEDVEPSIWQDSKWRCYRVQWDAAGNPALQERVSPWKITPISDVLSHTPVQSQLKRSRSTHFRSPPESSMSRSGLPKYTSEPTRRSHEVLQGQEIIRHGVKSSVDSNEWEAQKIPSSPVMAPNCRSEETASENCQRQVVFESWTDALWRKPLYRETHLSIPSQLSAFHSLSNPCINKTIIEKPVIEPSGVIVGVSMRQFDSHRTQEVEFFKPTESIDKGGGGSTCRIFGVNFTECPRGPPLSLVAASEGFAIDSDQLSRLSKSSKLSESTGSGCYTGQSSESHPITARSCTKLYKQGTAIGRSVDLSRFSGYGELTIELDRMFKFEGGLVDKKEWQVIYTDDEGDIMMFGDYPWQEFCSMVRKIYIYTKEVIDKVNAGMLSRNDLEELLVGKEACT